MVSPQYEIEYSDEKVNGMGRDEADEGVPERSGASTWPMPAFPNPAATGDIPRRYRKIGLNVFS
jgi:hypothetical protein